MSHTQCDARQQSRFELWSSEQWGHRVAGGINLLAYNAAFPINGGSGSTVWKMPHCLIARLGVAKRITCCLTRQTETMDRKECFQHSHIAFWPLFPLNPTDSSVLFLLLARLSTISICCNSILPRPLLSFLLTGLLQYFTSIHHSLFICLFSA